jgi:hypothetical protein
VSWVLFQIDVLGETFERFFQLIGKLIEVRSELLLLIFFTFTPVIITELVNKRFEDLVDDGVQGVNGVFADLTKKYLVVTASRLNDFFALRCSSEEVTPLTVKLDFLSIRDEELFGTVEVLNISRVVDLVRNLKVHKDTF